MIAVSSANVATTFCSNVGRSLVYRRCKMCCLICYEFMRVERIDYKTYIRKWFIKTQKTKYRGKIKKKTFIVDSQDY
jgi:hypothetical protein